jgi:EAL domain-containing protein (putative c-di-GMP-specific phosphodiesterase class I)/signal transduction histidine kinase/FixJ family two-component response regulator
MSGQVGGSEAVGRSIPDDDPSVVETRRRGPAYDGGVVGRVRLTEDDAKAIRVFWEFLEPRESSIGEALLDRAGDYEAVARLLRADQSSPDTSWSQVERAAFLDGTWEPFLDRLRRRGIEYAEARIAYSDWVSFVSATQDVLCDAIYREPFRPSDRKVLLQAMFRLQEIAITTIGDAYLQAKEHQLRAFEDQLRRAQQLEALGAVAGSVAHDFNNVLTVIKSCASLLEEQLAPDTVPHEDALEIRRAAERGSAITGQLLASSRPAVFQPRVLQLDDVITRFVPMVKRLLGPGIALVQHRGAPPTVVADQGQIEQVIMNLAINGRDAMPDATGRLTIETTGVDLDADAAAARGLAPGRHAVITVTDTGHGIDAETRQRIFDPYFTTKEVGRGTGLGLSIVRGIVAQARGAIALTSEPGRGTAFTIHLPAADATAVNPSPTPLLQIQTLPPITVLVVDDQVDLRVIATRVLQTAGCRVLEAATADEARRLCASPGLAIDVVLLDVLPGADPRPGIEALAALRPGVPVVLMSGAPLADHPGALAKPFGPSELRSAIGRALPAEQLHPDARGADAARTRVLIADDDEDYRVLMTRGLRRQGFEVIAVADGRRALDAIASTSFDVVISDVHMPECGGIELLREVRRVDLDVPVVLISGALDVASASAAVEYGAFRYLEKPEDVGPFGDVLRRAARAHALARVRRQAHQVSGSSVGAVDRAGTEVRFEQAMAALWVAFQPIIDVGGAPYGVEALMRSNEPSMSSPSAILDAAGQLGRLDTVGRRVRSIAADQVGDGILFVNLHPGDLLDPDLVDPRSPLTALASRTVLEITERAALASTDALARRLAQLRELGFRFAIDDIGAGYSGLTSFTEVVPEIVKLDMALVRDVHRNSLKQRTIAALCALCHDVGTKVVAEGVETIDERTCLISLGCDLLQGFLIGRPVAAKTKPMPLR